MVDILRVVILYNVEITTEFKVRQFKTNGIK